MQPTQISYSDEGDFPFPATAHGMLTFMKAFQEMHTCQASTLDLILSMSYQIYCTIFQPITYSFDVSYHLTFKKDSLGDFSPFCFFFLRELGLTYVIVPFPPLLVNMKPSRVKAKTRACNACYGGKLALGHVLPHNGAPQHTSLHVYVCMLAMHDACARLLTQRAMLSCTGPLRTAGCLVEPHTLVCGVLHTHNMPEALS